MKRTIFLLAIALFALSAFAEKQAPPAPATPHNFAIPQIRKFELPNGLKVRFVPYGAVPKVTVSLVVQTGNVDEGANEVWLADLTADMMEQGTTTRSAEQIAREAALMGGNLSVDVAMNQTSLAADVFTESGPAAVSLIADVARNPLFPEADLERLKADSARNLSIARSTPQSIAQERFAAALYPNHPYGRVFPTEAMLAGYTLAQVKGFHEHNFGAARSFLYVVGLFDAASMERAVRDAFGGWKAGNPPTKITLNPVSKRAVYFIERPGAVQSTLYIGLPLAIDPSNTEFLPVQVMNSLLGGSFGSRITSNIREQKGYTYSPQGVITGRPGGGPGRRSPT